MSELLDMGKHANFIWISYGVTFVVIVALGFASWQRNKRLKDRITQMKEKRNLDTKE